MSSFVTNFAYFLINLFIYFYINFLNLTKIGFCFTILSTLRGLRAVERATSMVHTVNEYIARYRGNTLYPKEVGNTYKKKNIYIDTTDPVLTLNLAKSYDMRKEGKEPKEIYNALIKYDLKVGSLIYCNDEEYKSGIVTEIFTSGNMFVKFKDRPLPTMCDSKSTIHDNKKRSIKHIA